MTSDQLTTYGFYFTVICFIGIAITSWRDRKKPKPRKYEPKYSNLTILQKDETDASGNRTFTVSGGWLPQSGAFEIVIEGEKYLVVRSD